MQNTINASTHIAKTPTQLSKLSHITKPTHTHTHTLDLESEEVFSSYLRVWGKQRRNLIEVAGAWVKFRNICPQNTSQQHYRCTSLFA